MQYFVRREGERQLAKRFETFTDLLCHVGLIAFLVLPCPRQIRLLLVARHGLPHLAHDLYRPIRRHR